RRFTPAATIKLNGAIVDLVPNRRAKNTERSVRRQSSACKIRQAVWIKAKCNSWCDQPCLLLGDEARELASLAPPRQIARTAVIIAGPTNSPIRPNVSRPPKMPRRTQRKGRRVDAPIKPGRTK